MVEFFLEQVGVVEVEIDQFGIGDWFLLCVE